MFVYGRLSFAAVLLCLGCTYAISKEDETSLKQVLRPHMLECAEEFGITEEQIEEAKKKGNKHNMDPCFLACMMKKADFMNSDGKFDVEKTVSFAKDHSLSEKAVKFFETVGEECVKVNDEEVGDGEKGCERAKLLFHCVHEIKKKMSE
uniref:Odorant binding protein n=1 Tax=Athetis dissimilis TaxID=1737331 RepID=A0A4D6Q5Z5_ATHDI|nr:odorant binding protein [Athetis dissimilis]